MVKKIKNTNFLFALALSLGLLYQIFYLFIALFSSDESFYVSIPYRLINGDSLIEHEWHLTQFSSLFTYLPVYIWTAIKGSTEGIFIFLRCLYLVIHIAITVLIYLFFKKKYDKWAIVAAMIFYVQIPHRILAISYQSMFVIFLLLFSLCLLSIYQKKAKALYIGAGICFACCCVCNPFFCFAFLLYLLGYALWIKQDTIKDLVIKKRTSSQEKKGKKLTNRQRKELKKELNNSEIFPNLKSLSCFFTKEALLHFTFGILLIAIVAVAFYLLTGGTFSAIPQNIKHLLGSSEYDVVSLSVFSKLKDTLVYFNKTNPVFALLLPTIFIFMFFDENKRKNSHRIIYLSGSILWSITYIFGFLFVGEFYGCAVSLPLFIFSTVCYLLTENKNKALFYCMYMPCFVASLFQYLAANTHLAAFGLVFVVNNIAGAFFVMDLFKEMRSDIKNKSEEADNKKQIVLCRNIMLVAFCIQFLFNGIYYQYNQTFVNDAHKVTTGPCSELYMSEKEYTSYNNAINDLDIIKSICEKDDPVLVVSYNNWLYLHLERPMATYTTWYQGILDMEQLTEYYKEHPQKRPKYIYIESADLKSKIIERNMDMVGEIFEFSSEELSNGVLLTVERCKL